MSTMYLYRHFDKDGALLYVGITNNIKERTRQHMKNSAWAGLINEVRHEEHDSFSSVYAAETAAIISENPPFNIDKSTSPYRAKWLRAGMIADDAAKPKSIVVRKSAIFAINKTISQTIEMVKKSISPILSRKIERFNKHRKIVKMCRNEELFIKEMGMSFADFDKHIESIESEYCSKGGKL